jgi:hypothetical protein
MPTRSEWRLALVMADRVTAMDMDTALQLAPMATTAMLRTPARPMATMDLIGSSAGSSLAPAHGSVGAASMAADSTVAGSTVAVASTAGEGTTAEAATMGAVLSATTQAADIEAVAASRRAGVVDSTAEVAGASMVEAATDK